MGYERVLIDIHGYEWATSKYVRLARQDGSCFAACGNFTETFLTKI